MVHIRGQQVRDGGTDQKIHATGHFFHLSKHSPHKYFLTHTHTRTRSDSRRKQLVEDMGKACLLQRDGVHGE